MKNGFKNTDRVSRRAALLVKASDLQKRGIGYGFWQWDSIGVKSKLGSVAGLDEFAFPIEGVGSCKQGSGLWGYFRLAG